MQQHTLAGGGGGRKAVRCASGTARSVLELVIGNHFRHIPFPVLVGRDKDGVLHTPAFLSLVGQSPGIAKGALGEIYWKTTNNSLTPEDQQLFRD